MIFKVGSVDFGALHPATHHALNVVDRVWRKIVGVHPVCTGLGEEGHSKNSKHYGLIGDIRCRAFDIRTRDLSAVQIEELDDSLRVRLAAGLEYDILWENDHLHIEHDPR